MYNIRSTKMLANFTDRRSSFPWGELHDLSVTDRDRNTQLLLGGAKTRTPPGRVFHTWASEISWVVMESKLWYLNYDWVVGSKVWWGCKWNLDYGLVVESELWLGCQ